MKRHAAPRSVVSNHSHNSVLDISIHGDELENHRVALENNLQHTEISLRLSSTSDSEGEDLYRQRPNYHQSRAYHDPPEEDAEQVSSVEYPRHNSNPGAFPEFVSFDRASREHLGGLGDLSHHSSLHPYSFSPDDDDERMHGIDPFPTPGFPSMSMGSGLGRGHSAGGETISTAAHHASALTLSPGYGGRYWAARRRDPSISGAEYDPDRPLKDMLDHVGMGMDRLSVFDIEPSRSRYPGVTSPNPSAKLDNTAELDRILQSGHVPAINIEQLRSPLNSSSSASSSSDQDAELASNTSARAKPNLADTLKNNLTFSPKRPRTMVMSPPRQTQARRKTRFADDEPLEMPTPKPKKRLSSMGTPHPSSGRVSNPQSRASTSGAPPPPAIDNSVVSATSVKSAKSGKSNGSGKTTSDAGSQFTRMARGLTKEIERQRGAVAESSRKALAAQEAARKEREEREREMERQLRERQEREREREAREREKAREEKARKKAEAAAAAAKAARRSALKKPAAADVSTGKGNVFLPDLTGLTSAVESPAKGLGMGGYRLYGGDGGSPREVEARFVATLNNVQSKLLALEEENGISRRRVRELEMELEECKREVKKERTRVLERESDLSMQRRQYDRKFKEKERRDKGKMRARDEDDWEGVERRYNDAVEEKKALESLIATLRSHLTRLTSELSSHQDLLTQLRELRDEDAGVMKAKCEEIEKLKEQVERLAGEIEVLRGVVEEGLKERRGRGQADETQDDTRQHHAEDDFLAHQEHQFDETAGATLAASINTPRHATDANRAARELSENTRQRHRNDYGYAYDASTAVPVTRFASRSLDGTRLDGRDEEEEEEEEAQPMRRMATVEDEEDEDEDEDDEDDYRPESPSPPSLASIQAQPSTGPSRPTHHPDAQHTRIPPPPHARPITSSPNVTRRHSDETPFPQIRGTHLEKLFFSAPDHDEKTCGVCQRRDRASGGTENEQVEEWFRKREQRRREEEEDEDDEGFAEDSDQFNENVPPAAPQQKGKDRDEGGAKMNPWKLRAQKEGLPPQTVVARVIRELEDDFTHYKGIYCELADQYKEMDPVSDVPKRNVLAKHLREVVDILEQKGDQIAALYETLTFKDKPVSESVVPPASQPAAPPTPLAKKLRNISTMAVASGSVARNGRRNV